jgi:uncharacterized protein
VSKADIETIRSGVEAYNRGKVEDLIALADPEVELVPVRSLLEGGSYRGHAGVRRFFEEMEVDWAERRVEIEEIRELGDFVLVLGEFQAVSPASGNEISFPLAWLTELRGGKLVRMQAFTDREAAAVAANQPKRSPLEAGMLAMADMFNRHGPAVLDDPAYLQLASALIHPEFEASSAGAGSLILPGTYAGLDGYLRFVRSWNDVWSEISYEVERFEEVGERGAAAVRVRGHGRGSGVEADMVIGWEFEVRDELLYRWRIYQRADEAFAAAGIEEPARAD